MSSKSKLLNKKIIAIAILVPVLLIATFVWWKSNLGPVSSNGEEKVFIIPKGKSAMQVGRKLYDEGFIRSTLVYKLYVQMSSQAEDIQAGEYRLSQNMGLAEVIDRLTSGPVGVWVTVPEGLRREEIADRFVNGLGLSGEEALEFRKEFLVYSAGKEGYLFPDTYLFQKGTGAERIVDTMLENFDRRVVQFLGLGSGSDVLEDDLIMASMLERETITDEERPVVAGILFKRLEADWPLQVDAAVQYGIVSSELDTSGSTDDYWPTLTKADLDSNSRYNTYKFIGLPPAPISNPGISSIEASVSPEESEYWYYIHDSDGVIHYATTLDEHNENVREYLGK